MWGAICDHATTKRVVAGECGSALMRDLDHALILIRATVGAVKIPVTLKMRLGWDDATRNAPELARRAAADERRHHSERGGPEDAREGALTRVFGCDRREHHHAERDRRGDGRDRAQRAAPGP